MKKGKLLPFIAYRGFRQNAVIYYPYLAACIFSVFTYFIFSSLLHNDLMGRLPRAAYAYMTLEVGKGLLRIILFLFLIYAGGFLQKRRQKERGLYSLLGMEKKQIAVVMLWEDIGAYLFSTVLGIGLGAVFGKLAFLVLLKMARLHVKAEFTFSFSALGETFFYFGVVFLLIYGKDIWLLRNVKPVELFSKSREGEKEPGHIWAWSAAGLIFLGQGYWLSVTSKLDSMIFMNFFLAVFFVILGTYLLFTSGSVAFLRLLKRKKNFYYKPANQVTVSGMLYRMKKNAAGLSNICIFSTMLLITLSCTIALWTGMEGVAYYNAPYDVEAQYSQDSAVWEAAVEKYEQLSQKYGIKASRLDCYDSFKLSCGKAQEENRFDRTDGYSYADQYGVVLITLADYNRLTGKGETLGGDEVFLYSTGAPFGFDTVDFCGVAAKVKGEPEEIYPYPTGQNKKFSYTSSYVIIVRDNVHMEAFISAWAERNGVTDLEGFLQSGVKHLNLLLDCEEEKRDAFVTEWIEWCQGQDAFLKIDNGLERRAGTRSMNGSLLFIGVIFGMVFFMSLLLIMYFKQVTEGYEDAESFAIMQKVGMSDAEIRATIKKQILLVFFLPLFGAILHTAAGMFFTSCLLATIHFFDTALLVLCCIGVAASFAAVYLLSYLATARTYYRIVRFGER